MTDGSRRLVVGISGASGAIYGIQALKMLRAVKIETHLVMSRSAQLTVRLETDLEPSDVANLADVVYAQGDIAAAISSGSFRTMGMLVAPCSIRTLGEIATGTTSSLLSRAADVTLKERRRLVLMVRETPLHLGHLRAMTAVTEYGAVVFPPLPAFYSNPKSIEDIVYQSVGRALDLFGLDCSGVRRWKEV
ncbi:MAG: UbiX family flavin prenyltransferase [Acetobacteraceae bacterium]